MGDGTKGNPLTSEDVLRLIEENVGTAEGRDLSGKVFEKGIDLSGFNLSGIVFDRAQLGNAHLEKAYLLNAHLKKADLVGAHLEGADLYGAHLEGAVLYSIRISSTTRLEDVDWGNYILGEEKKGWFEFAADTYRKLKQWYTTAGMYDVAGKFFFREMTARRKQMAWRPNPIHRAWSKFLSLICGYGERPLRVIAWAASVVSGLALIYFLIGSVWEWSAFWNSLYFGAVSFTALGYGSWVKEAAGWVKWLGAFESFIGVFSIALFLVTFTRKMTR